MSRSVGVSIYLLCFLFFSASSSVQAGFQVWSTEITSDPFNGGISVASNYADSLRSVVFVECSSETKRVTIKIIHGFQYTAEMESMHPKIRVAVDGAVTSSFEGSVGSFGDNIAGSYVELYDSQSKDFARKFASARKSVDFQSELSTGFFSTSARGTTKAGEALSKCIG